MVVPRTSHVDTVPSSSAAASVPLSGLNATPETWTVWPVKVPTSVGLAVVMSHSATGPSMLPAATRRPDATAPWRLC